MSLERTLGCKHWLAQHEDDIRKLLPELWTHVDNLNGLKIGFGLKLIGVDWRSEDQFVKVMIFLEKVGILQRQNGYQVRRNPSKVFS